MANGEAEKFVFFWGHRQGAPFASFSQFHICDLSIDGRRFNCTEQWMHWRKAELFGDAERAAQILAAHDPAAQKKLGRGVTPFDAAIWAAVARDIVFRGNIAKFGQNPELLEILIGTAGKLIVEASPLDRVWGIGLAADDPRARDRTQWQGTNWLGEILTEVRKALCGV